jgi:hypothetical protein
MSNLGSEGTRRSTPTWVPKLIWLAAGIVVFVGGYFVGDYVAPTVAGILSIITALYRAIMNALRMITP